MTKRIEKVHVVVMRTRYTKLHIHGQRTEWSKRKKVFMWQIICLCLPAMTKSEQQRFFTLFSEVLRAYGREPGEVDIGLFFLHSLSPEESLTVLEQRLDLVIRSQELMGQQPEEGPVEDIISAVIDDHIRTLLAAEHEWLKRSIRQLHLIDTHEQQTTGTHDEMIHNGKHASTSSLL